MRAKNAFIVLFLLILNSSVSLAWTNPSGNPPAGGGALSISTDGNKYVLIDTPAPGRQLRILNGGLRLDNSQFIRWRNAAGTNTGGFVLAGGDQLEWHPPGANTAALTIAPDGKVGIGGIPSEMLDVIGEIRFGYPGDLGGLENDSINSFFYFNTLYDGNWKRRDVTHSSAKLSIGGDGLSLDYSPCCAQPIPSWTNWLTIQNTGNVGIGGATLPGGRLVVVGSAGSVSVTNTGDEIRFSKNGDNKITAVSGNLSRLILEANINSATTNNTRVTIGSEGMRISNRVIFDAPDGPDNNIVFTATNPILEASGPLVIPGGAYFNGSPVYLDFSAPIFARGSISNDAVGASLLLNDSVDVSGELRTRDPASSTINRVWGQGRLGGVDSAASDCTAGGIRAAISNLPVHWDGAAAACPVGWWVCWLGDVNKARGGGTCGAGLNRRRFACGGGTANDPDYWTAGGDEAVGQNKGITITPAGVGNTQETCEARRVWCCAKQ